MARRALRPGGRVVFVDDGPGGAAAEDVVPDGPVPAALRRLTDGRRFRIVKVFHEPGRLTDELAGLGWSARVRPVLGDFIAGVARPTA